MDDTFTEMLREFGATGDVVPLSGGEGGVLSSGNIILKKAFNAAESAWIGENFERVTQSGFRLARPLRSQSGAWVIHGWTAQERVEGSEVRGRWEEKIKVCKDLHASFKSFSEPQFMRAKTDSYTAADRMVWGEVPSVVEPVLEPHVRRLAKLLRPVALPNQLIHGDLSGNILFADNLAPAVIDLSLYWRPAEFAAAVIIVDALSWEGAGESVIDLVSDLPEYKQMLVRAELGRLLQKQTLFSMYGVPIKELGGHVATVDLIEKLLN